MLILNKILVDLSCTLSFEYLTILCALLDLYSIISIIIFFYISTNDDGSSVYSKFITNELGSWTRIFTSCHLHTDQINTAWNIQTEYLHHTQACITHKLSPQAKLSWHIGLVVLSKSRSQLFSKYRGITYLSSRTKVASATEQEVEVLSIKQEISLPPLKPRRWFSWVSSS